MSGDGNVQVVYRQPAGDGRASDEEFRTRSSRINAQFREADGSAERITQSGNFLYEDGVRTAKSGVCDYLAATETLVLSDHPSIDDRETRTSGERIEYNRKERVLAVRRNVRSSLKSAGEKSGFLTSSTSAASPVMVTADEMLYWIQQEKARYSGNVRLWSTENQMTAHALVILNREQQVEAEGEVKHTILRFGANPKENPPKKAAPPGQAGDSKPVIIQSARLQYSRASNRIHYTDNVRLTSADFRLRAERMDILLDAAGNKVERAHAKGALTISQAEREAKGDEAEYDLVAGKIDVTGKPATMFDREKKITSRAPRLTFFIADDRILLGR